MHERSLVKSQIRQDREGVACIDINGKCSVISNARHLESSFGDVLRMASTTPT